MPDLTRHLRSPILWPLLGLVLLVLLNLAIGGSSFLRITLQDGHLFGMPIDILNRGSYGMLLALGMTLVIATGGIDLSVGSIVAVSGAVAATLLSRHGASVPAALAVALLVSLAAGLLSGTLVARFGIQPIVATLILMVGGRGVAQLVTGGDVVVINNPTFAFLGNGYLLGLPFAAIIAIVLYLATHLFLRRTAAGLFIEAVGDNETASRFAGLAAARVKILVYAFCSLCAGLAGILAASNIHASDPYRAGENMELDAIFAVVVGGTALTGGRFLLAGAFLGALLLQTLTITMYNIGVPPAIATVPKAIIILAVCLAPLTRQALMKNVKWRMKNAQAAAAGAGASPAVPATLATLAAPGAPVLPAAPVVLSSGSGVVHDAPRPPTTPAPPITRTPSGAVAPHSTFYISHSSLGRVATASIAILLFAAASLLYNGFCAPQVVINFFTDNAFLGIVAVGMTLVIFTGGIDLSVGAVVGFSAIFTATLIQNHGIHPALAAALSLSVGALFGAFMGAIIHFFKQPPFLITLAGMFLARGSAFWITTDQIEVQHPLYNYIRQIEWDIGSIYIPLNAVLLIFILIAGYILAHHTRFGRNLIAIGGNEQSALLMGLPVGATKVAVYALSSFLAALGGIVAMLAMSGNPSLGNGLELDAIAVVVIGGTLLSGGRGHMLGTLLGFIAFSTIQSAITFDGRLNSAWTRIVVAALLLVFILLQRTLANLKIRNSKP